MRTEITLIALTPEPDDIGQQIMSETSRTVLGDSRNVSMSEWTNAQQLGLSAEYEVRVFSADYQGERLADYQGKRYRIYRTYRAGMHTELYLSEAVGHGEG